MTGEERTSLITTGSIYVNDCLGLEASMIHT